jgi:hypothetical protein
MGNAKARRHARRRAARMPSRPPMTALEFMDAVWTAAVRTPVNSVVVLVPEGASDPEGAALVVLEPLAGAAR